MPTAKTPASDPLALPPTFKPVVPARGTAAFGKYAAGVMTSELPIAARLRRPAKSAWRRVEDPSFDWKACDFAVIPKPATHRWYTYAEVVAFVSTQPMVLLRHRGGVATTAFLVIHGPAPDKYWYCRHDGGLSCTSKTFHEFEIFVSGEWHPVGGHVS
jgi:hypothetical protein